MIRIPRYDNFWTDLRQSQFARDLLQSLGYLPDTAFYTLDNLKWSVPVTINVPLYKGLLPRAKPPDVVRCARAVSLDNLTTPVHFGACSWTWAGNNQVQILDVAGLVPGNTYRLTFEVVST